MQVGRPGLVGVGGGVHRRLQRRRPRGTRRRRRARLDWGASARRPCLPGRYDTVLPPTAVADLMIYLAWTMDGRAAHEGRPRSPGRRRHCASASGSRPCRSPWPATRARPGWRTSRSSPPRVPTRASASSTTARPPAGVDWVREGVITELAYSRAEAAEFGTTFAPPGDNLLLTGGAAAPSTTSSPPRTAASCSRAFGTSAGRPDDAAAHRSHARRRWSFDTAPIFNGGANGVGPEKVW